MMMTTKTFRLSGNALDQRWHVIDATGRPLGRLAVFLWKVVDVLVIDGAVLLSATISRASGRRLRQIHTGRLEHYLAALLVGMLVLLAVLVTKVI